MATTESNTAPRSDMSDEQLEAISEFAAKADTSVKNIIYSITTTNHRLKDEKPDNPFHAFIWDVIRSGEVTTENKRYIQSFLNDKFIKANVVNGTDDNGEAIIGFIQNNIIQSVEEEIEYLGKSPAERL